MAILDEHALDGYVEGLCDGSRLKYVHGKGISQRKISIAVC